LIAPAAQLGVSAFISLLIHRMFLPDALRLLRWPASCDEKQGTCFCLLWQRMKDMNLDRLLYADRGSR
jgi:hypothetical protein